MGFILIDFKKKEERKQLRKLVPQLVEKMSVWVSTFECDDTPPSEDGCKTLEDEKIERLIEEFNVEAEKLWRVADERPKCLTRLQTELSMYKGRLFAKFSDEVNALKIQAEDVLKHCIKSLQECEEELQETMPMAESQLENEFKELIDTMTAHIDRAYPGGVDGLDSYDDELPEGIPAFSDFKAMVAEKETEYKELNQQAIPGAIEKIKADTTTMVKTKINEAVEAAMQAIVEDLSDDVLPYLDEEQMAGLREELIASAKDYGATRVDT